MVTKSEFHKAHRFPGLLLFHLYALSILLPLGGQGQSDTEIEQFELTVKVIVEGDKTPVPRARVIISGPNSLQRWGTTNSKGTAKFSSLPRQELTVQVVATDHDTQGIKVKPSQATVEKTVTLKKSQTLPEAEEP